MARITPLFRTEEISIHRFDHPAEHEDRPYEEVASAYMASFVEDGAFHLETGGAAFSVGAGDVMLSRPGMRFRAGFNGAAFNDTCLTLTYLASSEDGFDAGEGWRRANRVVLKADNRLRYLRWGLQRAVSERSLMFAEFCATEIFREAPASERRRLVSDRRFDWFAERIDHARRRLSCDLEEELTASDLARETGMSMFHFVRIFGELVGEPPHRFRLHRRLDAARRFIREGMSATDACYAAGFNNLSHFSRSFARRFGAPPSRFTA